MKAGKYADGAKVLRAKIDLANPNMLLRDPILYRIKKAHHHRTGINGVFILCTILPMDKVMLLKNYAFHLHFGIYSSQSLVRLGY